MREFDYDGNEDFQNDIDNFWKDSDDDDEEDEYEDDMDDGEFLGYSKQEVLRAMELELVEREIDLKMLKLAIEMSEKSFWWRFYSLETRLRIIAKSYLIFKSLTIPEKDDESLEK